MPSPRLIRRLVRNTGTHSSITAAITGRSTWASSGVTASGATSAEPPRTRPRL
jgi:hypothetical protein